MPRPKKSSAVLEKATKRLAGMKSIDPALDFGDGLSLSILETELQELQNQLFNYNMMLSTLDEAAGQMHATEQSINDRIERMLMGAAMRYGKSSLQYMQAGGTQRKSTKRSSPTTSVNAAIPIVAFIPNSPAMAALN